MCFAAACGRAFWGNDSHVLRSWGGGASVPPALPTVSALSATHRCVPPWCTSSHRLPYAAQRRVVPVGAAALSSTSPAASTASWKRAHEEKWGATTPSVAAPVPAKPAYYSSSLTRDGLRATAPAPAPAPSRDPYADEYRSVGYRPASGRVREGTRASAPSLESDAAKAQYFYEMATGGGVRKSSSTLITSAAQARAREGVGVADPYAAAYEVESVTTSFTKRAGGPARLLDAPAPITKPVEETPVFQGVVAAAGRPSSVRAPTGSGTPSDSEEEEATRPYRRASAEKLTPKGASASVCQYFY